MRVLLAHSGLQHSHQLAWALHEAGDLLAFWSGVPVADPHAPGAGWERVARGLRKVPIPGRLRRHPVIFPLLRRLIDWVAPPRLANSAIHRLDQVFDRWVARRVGRLRPDVVICYENAALQTFRAARAAGAVCVLDAASIHYREGARWLSDTGLSDPPWVHRRKQDELDCADAILACSPLAAETYRENGVPAAKVYTCALGTELPSAGTSAKPASEACRFVFVGLILRRKGIDVLLDAFASLRRNGVQATLSLIGSVVEEDLAARARSMPGVTLQPHLPRDQLFAAIADHDCLILPSRFDAFGMVVPEGMAMGLPAIVSSRVGAKCIIEQHPDAGWIVPFDAEALREQMQELAGNRELLARKGRAARAAVLDYTWEGYRRRVVDTLRDIHERTRSSR